MEIPALVASANPSSFSLSSVSTVFCWSGHLIAAPDDIAELLLAGGFVEKSELPRPDLIENDAARCGFNRFWLRHFRKSFACRNPGS